MRINRQCCIYCVGFRYYIYCAPPPPTCLLARGHSLLPHTGVCVQYTPVLTIVNAKPVLALVLECWQCTCAFRNPCWCLHVSSSYHALLYTLLYTLLCIFSVWMRRWRYSTCHPYLRNIFRARTGIRHAVRETQINTPPPSSSGFS
ncbi:unnamed protein product [Chondrus crispus]|uniref:Uncharacterized protein n=1 Tax=Chondrus crispus TaxID=2769 RepID=R7QIA5_CHOCR|nr:unnamed protein product [Chondrus crispus]CDF38252.1 unnamed protein product [Chondrus crispus]|eukprot:XP_005718137.1 unnamed protein product [Chondrus crispus]